jgi:hypothetical protein
MSTFTKKTYEEHRQYLHSIVSLKLWFAWWWQHNHEDESFSSILRTRVDIYRKTDINQGTMNPDKANFDDPEWRELERKLCAAYQEHCADSEAAPFENAAFLIVQPTIDARARRDYEERPYVLDYQCGSLKYDKPKKKHPKCVSFHIANAIAPQSIFADKKYLPQCFTDLMKRSASEYGADSLCTHTWLNSNAKWLELFPMEWSASMEPEDRDVQWHFGFWGQFITAQGAFNSQLGRRLRETGQFPFWPRYSWCSFRSLRKHLSELLSNNTQYCAEPDIPCDA